MSKEEEVLKHYQDSLQGLVDKDFLILTVRVENVDQAEWLNNWLCSKEKPTDLPFLDKISWDQALVSKEEAEFIEKARKLFIQY